MLSGSVAICGQPAAMPVGKGRKRGHGAIRSFESPPTWGREPLRDGPRHGLRRVQACTTLAAWRETLVRRPANGACLFQVQAERCRCTSSPRCLPLPAAEHVSSLFPHPVFELTRSDSEMLLHGAGGARSELEAAAGTASALACAATGTTTASSASSWHPSAPLCACAPAQPCWALGPRLPRLGTPAGSTHNVKVKLERHPESVEMGCSCADAAAAVCDARCSMRRCAMLGALRLAAAA